MRIVTNVIEKFGMKRALEMWGEKSQLGMVQEECGELIAVINQYQRGRAGADQVAEELADVFIMLSQLERIVGEHRTRRWIDRKLKKFINKVRIAAKERNIKFFGG